MSTNYKTTQQRKDDALLDRVLAAEARVEVAERQAIESLELAHRAIDERDEARRETEVLRQGIERRDRARAAQGGITESTRREMS